MSDMGGWRLGIRPSGYFLPILSFYVYHDYVMPCYDFVEFTSREQESSEFILSNGFFLFVLRNRFRQIEDFGVPEYGFLSATKHAQ
jgi:hypothetical protein